MKLEHRLSRNLRLDSSNATFEFKQCSVLKILLSLNKLPIMIFFVEHGILRVPRKCSAAAGNLKITSDIHNSDTIYTP